MRVDSVSYAWFCVLYAGSEFGSSVLDLMATCMYACVSRIRYLKDVVCVP